MNRSRLRRQLVLVLRGVLGVTLVSALWRAIQYSHRLWRQPKLVSRAIRPSELDVDQADLDAQAVRIAAEDLRAGIERRRLRDGQEKWVLNAGLRNFREPWARDFGFASYGLLALGEHQVVREGLEVFLIHQAPNGQFPVKVHSTSVVNRYVHSLFGREQPTTAPLKPKYITSHNTISLDGNALLVNAALQYAAWTGDHEFTRSQWDRLDRAMTWLEQFAEQPGGLLSQGAFTDWADTIARQGRVLYTNMIYWKALQGMASAADAYGLSDRIHTYRTRYEKVAEAIQTHFWRPDLGYFVTSAEFDNLTSSGNLLAIAWGLADRSQSQAILDAMEAADLADPVPTRAADRPYPSRFIALENRLAGLAHYHTDAAWLWLGAWHVIGALRAERPDLARTLLSRIARVVVRDGEIHEVYAPDGHYISNFWYTSEAPLTWSAGMLVYASYLVHRYQEGDPASATGGVTSAVRLEFTPKPRSD